MNDKLKSISATFLTILICAAALLLPTAGIQAQMASADADKCKEIYIYDFSGKMVSSVAFRSIIKNCDDGIRATPADAYKHYNRGIAAYYLIREGNSTPFDDTLSRVSAVSDEELQKALADLQMFINDKGDTKHPVEHKLAIIASSELTAVSAAKNSKPALYQTALSKLDEAETYKTPDQKPGDWWEKTISGDRVSILANQATTSKSFFSLGADALIARAKEEIAKGDHEAAVNDLTLALNLESKNAEAYTERARANILLKKFDVASADAEAAIRLDPKNAEAVNVRGVVKLNRQEPDAALADFSKAISLKPDFIKAYMNRANLSNDKKDYAQALADYTKVIELDSSATYPRFLRGSVYLHSLKNYDAAIRDYTEAIRLSPAADYVYSSRATAYTEKAMHNEAIADYTKAIQIDPKDALYYHFRGLSYAAAGKPELAIADFRKTLELDPKDETISKKLAELTNPAPADTDAALREMDKKFHLLIDEFNPLSTAYTAKANALAAVLKNNSTDKAANCKLMFELTDVILPLEKAIDKLEVMYKNGDIVKVASVGDQAVVKKIVEEMKYSVLKRKLALRGDITVSDCQSAEKKTSMDDLLEEMHKVNEQHRRDQVIEILENLDDMANYFAAAKKFSALNTATPAPEVCRVALAFKKESDDIEEDLTKLDDLYEEFGEIKFDDPSIAASAQKMLDFHTQLFLPTKAEITRIIGKYGCK